MIEISTLGDLAIKRNGVPISLPASRKTRALCAYLALSPNKLSRQALCDVFYDIPDDPRGALRWSLSRLRAILNSEGESGLVTSGDWLEIDRRVVSVDLLDVQSLMDRSDADRNELVRSWEALNLGFLLDCEISGQPIFSEWLASQRQEAACLRAQVARRLALDPDCPDRECIVWADRWLADMEYDADAAKSAVEARYRTGQRRQASELQAKLAERFRDADLPQPKFKDAVATSGAGARSTRDPLPEPMPRQSIRLMQARDGTSIAWSSVGEKDLPPIVKAAYWLSHLEHDWGAPIWSPLFRELAQGHRLIRYDERGCGLSDWDVDDISFEALVTDLEEVVDAAGVERFPLIGISQGAAVSIEYAARHPERVSHLILFGGYPAGWRYTETEEGAARREAVMTLTSSEWGWSNPMYRRLFSKTFVPDATEEELEWFDNFQEQTTSGVNAARFLGVFGDLDVRDSLKKVTAPTLVVHSRGDQRIPVSASQQIAAEIPDSELVTLDSRNHLLLGREEASDRFLEEIRRFIAS